MLNILQLFASTIDRQKQWRQQLWVNLYSPMKFSPNFWSAQTTWRLSIEKRLLLIIRMFGASRRFPSVHWTYISDCHFKSRLNAKINIRKKRNLPYCEIICIEFKWHKNHALVETSKQPQPASVYLQLETLPRTASRCQYSPLTHICCSSCLATHRPHDRSVMLLVIGN